MELINVPRGEGVFFSVASNLLPKSKFGYPATKNRLA